MVPLLKQAQIFFFGVLKVFCPHFPAHSPRPVVLFGLVVQHQQQTEDDSLPNPRDVF